MNAIAVNTSAIFIVFVIILLGIVAVNIVHSSVMLKLSS